MKTYVFALAILTLLLACEKEAPVVGDDYRDVLTGYYPMRVNCTDYDVDSNVTGYSDTFTYMVRKQGDSSLILIPFRDTIRFQDEAINIFKIDIYGNFKTDSIEGLPRSLEGKFGIPSKLQFKTFTGSSFASTYCYYVGYRTRPLEPENE